MPIIEESGAAKGEKQARPEELMPTQELKRVEAPADYEEELKRWQQQHDRDQTPATGEIDAAEFVKAQSDFIRVQTWFLTHGSEKGSLVRYSLAQNEFIAAQNRVLEALGVV